MSKGVAGCPALPAHGETSASSVREDPSQGAVNPCQEEGKSCFAATTAAYQSAKFSKEVELERKSRTPPPSSPIRECPISAAFCFSPKWGMASDLAHPERFFSEKQSFLRRPIFCWGGADFNDIAHLCGVVFAAEERRHRDCHLEVRVSLGN